VIVRIFTGESWTASTDIRDAEFDALPREGEKLVIENGDQWIVATVQDVAHRVTGDSAADVALLLGPVRESPMGDDALPLAALDDDELLAIKPAMPPTTRGGPWRR
jgi:hypothetical protein